MSQVPLSFLVQVARGAGYPPHKSDLQTRLKKEGAVATKGPGRTSPVFYDLHTLPDPLRRAWEQFTGADGAAAGAHDDDAWEVFSKRAHPVQVRARVKAEMMGIVTARRRAGVPLERISAELPGMPCQFLRGRAFGARGTSPRALKAMLARIEGVDPINWAFVLADETRGHRPACEIPRLAMAWFRQDYRNSGEDKCRTTSWHRLVDVAPQSGWVLPAQSTFMKYYNALPADELAFDRDGKDGVRAILRQRNSRKQPDNVLDWLCMDGTTLSSNSNFDGVKKQLMIISLTDIATGFMFEPQLCKSEDAENTLIAIAKACAHGKPGNIYTDNGSGFASLRIAGDNKNAPKGRKPRDQNKRVPGVLQEIGVALHFARVWNPEAKPIEPTWARLKRELHTMPELINARISKFSKTKAGRGPKTDNEPQPVELDKAKELVLRAVGRINDRPNAKVHGYPRHYSRRQAFEAWLARLAERDEIRPLTAVERRKMSLKSKLCQVQDNGDIRIDNNYWGDEKSQVDMFDYRNKKVCIYFDPLDEKAPLIVWNEDETTLICRAMPLRPQNVWGEDASLRRTGVESKRVTRRTHEIAERNAVLDKELKLLQGGAQTTVATPDPAQLATGSESAVPVSRLSDEAKARYRQNELDNLEKLRAARQKLVG